MQNEGVDSMIVYIDKDHKCHAEAAEGLIAVENVFFDGKCKEFIEGYRLVPAGESWTREDGEVFEGEMIAAWKPIDELDAAQRSYDIQLAEAARILLGEV